MSRILCIDDSKHGCFARRTLLEEMGHDVLVAHDGKAGLEMFAGNKVDLVVVDYIMPGMNGAEVVRRIRGLNTRVPIIVLSGYIERYGLDDRFRDADATLHKGPREIKELEETVARLLKKTRRKPAGRAKAKTRTSSRKAR
jgi:CheY-like chemotaxis protein